MILLKNYILHPVNNIIDSFKSNVILIMGARGPRRKLKGLIIGLSTKEEAKGSQHWPEDRG